MLPRGSSRGTMTMRRRAVGKTPATTGIKKEEGQGELTPGKMPTAPPAGKPALSPRQYDSLFNPARLHCQAEASKFCCVPWSRSREAGLARHQRITMSSVDCAIRLTEATLEVRVLGYRGCAWRSRCRPSHRVLGVANGSEREDTQAGVPHSVATRRTRLLMP